MPRTEVILFKEDDESVPLVEWLESVPKKPQAKCVAVKRKERFRRDPEKHSERFTKD